MIGLVLDDSEARLSFAAHSLFTVFHHNPTVVLGTGQGTANHLLAASLEATASL